MQARFLFKAKVSPFMKGTRLNKNVFFEILNSVEYIIKLAIKKGGSTIKDYSNPNRDLGYFQTSFKVYDRENLSCYDCNNLITKVKQNGRSTYYCAKCQY